MRQHFDTNRKFRSHTLSLRATEIAVNSHVKVKVMCPADNTRRKAVIYWDRFSGLPQLMSNAPHDVAWQVIAGQIAHPDTRHAAFELSCRDIRPHHFGVKLQCWRAFYFSMHPCACRLSVRTEASSRNRYAPVVPHPTTETSRTFCA